MPKRIEVPPPETATSDDKSSRPAHFSPIKGETGETWVLDEWGLLVRKTEAEPKTEGEAGVDSKPEEPATISKAAPDAEDHVANHGRQIPPLQDKNMDSIQVHPGSAQDLSQTRVGSKLEEVGSDSENDFKDAQSTPNPEPQELTIKSADTDTTRTPQLSPNIEKQSEVPLSPKDVLKESSSNTASLETETIAGNYTEAKPRQDQTSSSNGPEKGTTNPVSSKHSKNQSTGGLGISEWSHQHTAPKTEAKEEQSEEDEWQPMPSYAPYDMYDDDNRLIAKEEHESDAEADAYAGLGGAGRGYTRVMLDEDAQSATSLDENTQYLFKDKTADTEAGEEGDEEQRDAVSQMQATKDLLTEGQRVAYVGMTRLILSAMVRQSEAMVSSKGSRKEMRVAAEAMQMWSQKMMVRLYAHMDISSAEQIMIEQLAHHGVLPADLSPALMANSRVKNPMADKDPSPVNSPSLRTDSDTRPSPSDSSFRARAASKSYDTGADDDQDGKSSPPPYLEHEGDDLPEVRTPSQLPTTKNIDIDLRWTVLCDLFLTLIADSVYDARSRVLLEKVGENMDVSWLEICRFEKRVTDALEMQQAAEKENWNEDDHKESRRKRALNKRYLMMGLATVGGSLVIGLSAGLLAPVIGAGLAAGFTTIGVAGTSGFLAGAGGAAVITSAAATSGGIIAIRAANRRTGAVKTFEYRPLHNNKRVNLIVTVSGWMTGKVDDVRLPYSTVDPIMGDIYSILWEPEMLRSMGDTINILATEALTSGLQQVLASTILMGLMAALQLPVILTKLSYLIDNPWTVSLARANLAGLILADSLIDRNLGTRPITFVGYSLGSKVIFSCLLELARKGAYGLVQNVYLFGSPIVANKDEYLKARSVVAGRFVNGYARTDWILGYLFRLTSGGISRVAGLAPVEDVPGLENKDVTDFVPGHMSYRKAMPRLLREVGWIVESDEFTEIEDPDPENHEKRQRELINEIEEARKELERKEKQAKGKFGFFGRKKKQALEKKEWETYEETKIDPTTETPKESDSNEGVLFDIDAIRAELASEYIEVKELKSTLPPMKIESPISRLGSPSTPNPRSSLQASQSYDQSGMLKATNAQLSPSATPRPSPQQSQSSKWSVAEQPASKWPAEGNKSPRWIPDHDMPQHEDEVQMTFDTFYETPPLSVRNSFHNLPSQSTPQVSSVHTTTSKPDNKVGTPQRPDLKSSHTLPATLPVMNIDPQHNAWADEDEDFGQEKEIEMTFA